MFQGTEGAEPGEGGQAPGAAQQPRVHGVALPGLGRAKGWSFDGKREVRGAQGGKLGVLQVPAYHPPLPMGLPASPPQGPTPSRPHGPVVRRSVESSALESKVCAVALPLHLVQNPGQVT